MKTADIRREKRIARAALSLAEQEDKSRQIIEQIKRKSQFQEAKCIFLYRAVAGEVSLEGLIEFAEAEGKKLCYPLCRAGGQMEALYPVKNRWQKGSYGILEPVLEDSEIMDPQEIDLILMPLVAFDRNCNRVGMGAGYYDRYLLRCPQAYRLGVAFEVQYFEELEPAPWDQALDLIITEDRELIGPAR
ncbi:MAG: 5-formyltetrahydrofolate cyclo-ligase [Eubacteriales bacterium]|nr:5-formyltetrahydrofolate cyclo-ligase [Eubacteriales bacterium]